MKFITNNFGKASFERFIFQSISAKGGKVNKTDRSEQTLDKNDVWKTKEQNKVLKNVKADLDNLKQSVYPLEVNIIARKYDTLGALVLGVQKKAKANKTSKKDFDINWGTEVTYNDHNGKETKKTKLSQANQLKAGDEVVFRKEGDKTVIIINQSAPKNQNKKPKNSANKVPKSKVPDETQVGKKFTAWMDGATKWEVVGVKNSEQNGEKYTVTPEQPGTYTLKATYPGGTKEFAIKVKPQNKPNNNNKTTPTPPKNNKNKPNNNNNKTTPTPPKNNKNKPNNNNNKTTPTPPKNEDKLTINIEKYKGKAVANGDDFEGWSYADIPNNSFKQSFYEMLKTFGYGGSAAANWTLFSDKYHSSFNGLRARHVCKIMGKDWEEMTNEQKKSINNFLTKLENWNAKKANSNTSGTTNKTPNKSKDQDPDNNIDTGEKSPEEIAKEIGTHPDYKPATVAYNQSDKSYYVAIEGDIVVTPEAKIGEADDNADTIKKKFHAMAKGQLIIIMLSKSGL